MKRQKTALFPIFILVFATATAVAQQNPTARKIIREIHIKLPVDLNTATVKCSAQGYSMPELKTLVPALAQVTILNHRNPGEGAPCITAGECTDQLNPEKLLAAGSGPTAVPAAIRLSEELIADQTNNVCHVVLHEDVKAIINGVLFSHSRQLASQDRTLADCR
jgi:hypothetical protein